MSEAAALEQDRLVRMEVERGWIQVQELHKQLGLLPVASFVVPQFQEVDDDTSLRVRSVLVDKVTEIISIFSSVVACLHSHSSNSSTSSEQNVSNIEVQIPEQQQHHHQTPSLVTTSDCSDQESSPKKRKTPGNSTRSTVTTTTTTSTVDPKNATEPTPDDDGHSWRKYGQKEILGSRYPKSYYRCTHKRESGCPAIKYVQRSDQDPSIFHVTYKGEHNCHLKTPNVFKKHHHMHHHQQHQIQNQHHQEQQHKVAASSPPPYYQVQMNSACLRMNSNGGLSLGPTGPTISPTLPTVAAATRCQTSSAGVSEEVVAEHTPFDLDFIFESPTLFSMDDVSLFDTEQLQFPCLLA